ncbi:ATP-dependent RNA helicase DHX33-like [Saccoglossus kowalevskii]|uniref:RNA helicase n=1 Tax=Saccoglossus kowalevskii TaxID=10224 RepID=A0ABM0GL56_SACKO|nr:PREDICTED: putative ATP-dependent RNA helicase DHX33-like [Saccoglossus kowalevskii]
MSGEPPKKKRRYSGSNMTGESAESLRQQRCHLPIYSARGRLNLEIRKTSSAIIIGETGSGKTTQIPQYLYESGMAREGMIACTQPRRVAAITVAQRVAMEMGVELGKQVGYCVRFDDMTSPGTKIKYMTDGMLLREAILDPLLSKYAVVILDEAHERTIHTDVLFGVIKDAQQKRKKGKACPLKVIVMSATMDVDHFSTYFNNAPVLYIEGREHPIELLYSSMPQSDYLFAAIVTVFQIHQDEPPGHDILVFLTGQEEIEAMLKSVKDIAKDLPSDCPQLLVCPMYAALPPGQQLKIFQPTPAGSRKVILATNIAETSITIQGIKHVIDTGKVKAKSYQPGSGLDLLKVQWVSKSQAWQRTGRSGREDSGTCWRLYTENQFQELRENTIPEIQRCNLSSVVLQLLALGIPNILRFDFMDKPSAESIINAVDQLNLLAAVEKKDKVQLTSLGKKMAIFPLEPRLSKVILMAKEYNCLEEILTIVSLLSVESVLFTPHNKREDAHAARKKFTSSDGDHIMLLNIYRAYKAVKGNKQWCFENFINMRHMRNALDIRHQLREMCVRAGLPIQSCGPDTSAIRKCISSGQFMNTAELQREGEYVTLDRRQSVSIHPSSCLFQCKPAYVLYNELVYTTKCYMRNICVVDPEWLYEAAPTYFKRRYGGKNR